MGDLQRILGILGEARRRLFRIVLVLGPLFGFCVTFRLQAFSFPLFGLTIPFAYPMPNLFDNLTAQVFRALAAWALPPGVVLLNVWVADSILVQVEIGLLLTL